jgi:tetratricopeptide (TPR) repeat protein
MTRLHWALTTGALASTLMFANVAFAAEAYSPPAPQTGPTTSSGSSSPSGNASRLRPRNPTATPDGASRTDTTTTGSGPRVRPEMGKLLTEAVELQKAQNLAGAMAKVREADAMADKTPAEEYVIAKFMGSLAHGMKDVQTAAAQFDRAVATNAATPEEKKELLRIAMSLNLEAKNYARAVVHGEALAALGPLEERSAVVLAQAYYLKGDYPNALKTASAALTRGITDPTLKAAALQVQTGAQAQAGDQSGALASLEQQCAEKCDGRTWGQLAEVTMSRMRGLTNKQALNIFRLRLAAGGMDADDYVTMASLDMQFQLPAEAQAALQKGIAAGTIQRSGRVAQILNQASTEAQREVGALASFEREAAARSNGDIDVKLGETYFAHGKFAQAETALRRGLGKGGVRDREDAQITLGIVLLAQGKKEEAVAAFTAAGSSPVVKLWTLYANRKG